MVMRFMNMDTRLGAQSYEKFRRYPNREVKLLIINRRKQSSLSMKAAGTTEPVGSQHSNILVTFNRVERLRIIPESLYGSKEKIIFRTSDLMYCSLHGGFKNNVD